MWLYWWREILLRKVININETQGISRISPDSLGGVWTRDYVSSLRLCYVCMYCLTDVMHVTKSPWPSAYPLRFCIILLSKNGGWNGLGTRLQLQSSSHSCCCPIWTTVSCMYQLNYSLLFLLHTPTWIHGHNWFHTDYTYSHMLQVSLISYA